MSLRRAGEERVVEEQSRWWRWAPAVVAFAIVAGLWQLAAVHYSLVIPTIGSITSALVHAPRLFLKNGLVTFRQAVVGLACGFAVAFCAAVAMSQVRVLERALMPLAVVVNVTPLVAIAPSLGLIFGFGDAPKYILTAVVVFFPFLVNATIGLRSIDREALDVLRTLDASRSEILWRLRLPSSLPFLFSAARVCFPLSIVGAIVAEFTASGLPGTGGLGQLIVLSSENAALGQQYAAILCLAVMGILFTAIVLLTERRMLAWHASSDPRVR